VKFKIILVAASAALALCAADAWKNTDFTQWSPEDAKKVLTKSPWSKEVAVSLGMPGGAPSNSSGSRRGGGGMVGDGDLNSTGGGGGGSRRGGGGEGGGGSTPSMNVIIRWETAIPVKEALMKLNFGDKLPGKGEKGYTLDAPQNDYVISVTGLRMGGRGRSQEASTDQQSSSDRMKDQLMTGTQLFRKGKDPIAPTNVVINSSNTAYIVFPKTDAISDDDKDVEFRLTMGRIQIKEKFSLKDMHFSGKLEL